MTLFRNKELISDPKVIIRKEDYQKNDFYFTIKQLEGAFYRVNPSNAKEVFFLQALPKNVFVYAPAEGNGLIITLNLF
jgi:hypothetical protein|tara:strand:+ start:20254 stop:20487 length:234 start_codon:yes stop_codon:yes gene_type:complete